MAAQAADIQALTDTIERLCGTAGLSQLHHSMLKEYSDTGG
jgi:hypothetical protein